MKLEILEEHANYTCQVIKLPVKQPVTGLDKLVKVTHQGNDILTQKDSDENQLYLFFPAECVISAEYLSVNNEFRHSNLNRDSSKTGFFEDSGRVKCLKFKGVISSGYIAPLSTLLTLMDINSFKVGDEFNSVNGHMLCKKYRIVRTQGEPGTKESRFNKKLKRFDKLVPNQFRFHESTSHLAKNLHVFTPEDVIVISSKWHGTSAVFSNVLIKKELTWKERLVKWFGIEVVDKKYDNLYSSRSVIKNQYINKEATTGYYNEDIWGVVNKELEGKIEQGITIYGEIVGFLSSGRAIQKNYDYSCSPGLVSNNSNLASSTDIPEHKFLVYRMTYTKPDGSFIELSWNQIKDYCKKYSLETVKELYFGKVKDLPYDAVVENHLKLTFGIPTEYNYMEEWFKLISSVYLEKDCQYCKNKVPSEGIVVRRDGLQSYSAYKLKSKRFLEQETKQLDSQEINIEDEA